MKKILAILVSVLTMLTPMALATGPEVTGSIGVGVSTPDVEPEAYSFYTQWDIGIDDFWGGDPSDLPNPTELRGNQYLFQGEQFRAWYLVRDANGIEDITGAKLAIRDIVAETDDDVVVCNEMDRNTNVYCEEYCTRNSCEGYTKGECMSWKKVRDFDFDGFGSINEATDRIYECTLTAGPYTIKEYDGEKNVHLATFRDGGERFTPDSGYNIHFNPAVDIELTTSDGSDTIGFGTPSAPGEYVHSTNNLKIWNRAQGGVDLWVWFAMEDLRDVSGGVSKCPTSNVFDVDGDGTEDSDYGVWYRTLSSGTAALPDWELVSNPNSDGACSFWDNGPGTCRNAKPIMGTQTPYDEPTINSVGFNKLGPNSHKEVQFKMKFPVPCIGDFTQGDMHVIVRAI